MPCLSLSVQRDTATLSNRSSGNSPRSGEQHLPSRASGRGSGVFGSRPPWPFSPGSMRSEGGAASHSPLFSQVQRLPFRLLVSPVSYQGGHGCLLERPLALAASISCVPVVFCSPSSRHLTFPAPETELSGPGMVHWGWEAALLLMVTLCSYLAPHKQSHCWWRQCPCPCTPHTRTSLTS